MLPILVTLLVAVPFAAGAVLLFTTGPRARNALVVAASVVTAGAAIAAAAASGGPAEVFFGLPGGLEPGVAILAAELAIGALIVVLALREGRRLPLLFVAAQVAIALFLELSGTAPEVEPDRLFRFDGLALVMVLVIGLVGTLICIDALGYMRDYQRSHPLVAGRRTSFFCLLFVFLGAMFGLVTANDLALLLVFWEVTTLCSFLLIGYTRTPETIGYAFRALNMNLFGGVGFSLALLLLASTPQGWDLAHVAAGPAPAAVLPAVALLALAGLTKSAQMPFSSWLLGAMYAPSPTSALLHSSTMVKAGVFLLLRLSPAMTGSAVGQLVALVGLLTFLVTALVAATEQNTKKVLAYSTIGNLGLIVTAAGIGGPEMAWVGMMIIVFHAVAKSLLFLVVGTLENKLYTKDMEQFDALLARLPKVSSLALTGIAGMVVAPFGIVIAKWTAIRAFLAVPGIAGAFAVTVLAFGSALTIFYWGKLLIKVLSTRGVTADERAIEGRISGWEWFAQTAHAAGVVALAAGVGVVSDRVAAPWAHATFPGASPALLNIDGVTVALLVVTVLALPALALWARNRWTWDEADVYAAGRSVTATHVMAAALGQTRQVSLRSYYLEGVVDGARAFRAGTVACAVALAAMVLAGLVVR